MCSGIIGASSFVEKKEHKTMETLTLYAESMKTTVRAKILGVFSTSYIITLFSFIAFGVSSILAAFYILMDLFSGSQWTYHYTVISPAVNLLSLTLRYGIRKVKNISGSAASKRYPCSSVISYCRQITGVIMLNNFIMVTAGAVLLIIDIYL